MPWLPVLLRAVPSSAGVRPASAAPVRRIPSVTLLSNCLMVMNSFGIHCDNVNQDELINSSHCTRSLGNSTTMEELINGPVTLVVLPMQSPPAEGMKQEPHHPTSVQAAELKRSCWCTLLTAAEFPSLWMLAEVF